MFFFLRNLYRLFYLGLLTCGVLYVYQNREVFDPAIALVQAFSPVKEGVEQSIVAEFKGKVTKVIDNESFNIKGPDSKIYLVKLTGISAPKASKQPRPDRKLLADLIADKEVNVQVTYADAYNRLLGVVGHGDMNINAAMILEGGAKVDKKLLKGLPTKTKYLLLKAERVAQSKVWKAIREE